MNDCISTISDAVDILNDASNSVVTYDIVKNKHFNNPSLLEFPIKIMRDENGAPMGMSAFMGMYLIENRNKESIIHKVTQTCDVAVKENYRGKRVFSNITCDFEENDKESEFSFNIPNDKSLPGYIKMGWEVKSQIATLGYTHTKFFLLIQDYIKKQKMNIYNNERVEIWNEAVFTSDELRLINRNDDVMFMRSNEYINWKLSVKDGQIIVVYDDDKLKGYIIIHINERKKYLVKYKQVYIDDWFYIDKDCFSRLLDMVKQEGYSIFVPLININCKDFHLFTTKGFKCKSERNLHPLIVSPRGKEAGFFMNLSIKGLDDDTMLNP